MSVDYTAKLFVGALVPHDRLVQKVEVRGCSHYVRPPARFCTECGAVATRSEEQVRPEWDRFLGGPKDESLHGRIEENYGRKDVCLYIVSRGMDGEVGAYLLGVVVAEVDDDDPTPKMVWSSQDDVCAAMNQVSEAIAGIEGIGPVSVVLGMDGG